MGQHFEHVMSAIGQVITHGSARTEGMVREVEIEEKGKVVMADWVVWKSMGMRLVSGMRMRMASGIGTSILDK